MKDEARKKTAEAYLALAAKYEEPSAWNNLAKAELCRGRAIQYATQIAVGNKSGPLKKWSAEFVKSIIDSGKPYSMAPDVLALGPKSKD